MVEEADIGDYLILEFSEEQPLPVAERIVKIIGFTGLRDSPLLGLDMDRLTEGFYALDWFERAATEAEAAAAEQRNRDRFDRLGNPNPSGLTNLPAFEVPNGAAEITPEMVREAGEEQ